MADPTGGSRRLHGVLLADMTGFSRLMGEDESRAVDALMRIRDVFAVVVPRHGGTLDVFVGDCFVALFDSAVDAVQAAIEIQRDLAAGGADGERVRIRIGIHLGDVVRSGMEILGDSVNVAARIQAIAPPGGITVSEDVYRAVRNRVKVPVRDLGAKSLKNIRGKMRVYAFDVAGAATDGPAPAAAARRPRALALAGVAVALILAGAVVGQRAGWWAAPPAVSSAVRSQAAPAAAEGETVTVGVTGVSALGEVPPWMQDTTRDGLNTLLSKVGHLRVFSREKIDFLRQRRGLTEIEVAETLGIQKMISGSLAMQNGEVLLDVRVVDISTGLLDASDSVRGSPDELIELQNQLASSVIAALGVHLSPEQEATLFAQRTRETLDGYRRLADTFGEAPESQAPPGRERTSWRRWPGGGVAWADDASAEVTALLEAYRAALEKKDIEAVAAVHVSLTDEQRAGFDRYFASADDLRVTIGDVDVLLDGDEGVVTFTRRDVFRDRNSDKDVELEVRLSTIVVRQDGRWLMRGVRRS
ncbi:hypothetical protein KF840_25655 [bacterium]|nr:hypothetical protein [bacterium]